MDCHAKLSKRLLILSFIVEMLIVLTICATAVATQANGKIEVLQFDSIIELNAPLCRTHVVSFTRYWISPELYRIAIVWAEPHAGSLNFPVFPRSLNVASDLEAFRIEHQFQHIYDGVYHRPLGQRGPFRHQFNSYYFSDVRFAEQDALDMRIYSKVNFRTF